MHADFHCSLDFISSIHLFQLSLQLMIYSDYSMASYWYHFDSKYWSAVYKHTYGKDFKFKAGYDSEVRLGWASLWVSAPIC